MARRDDAKDAALAASRTLNSDPQRVTDPAFTAGGFFDPADLLQVKYEMVRKVEVEGVPVSAAARAFGFARQSVYNAQAALAAGRLAGLPAEAVLPGRGMAGRQPRKPLPQVVQRAAARHVRGPGPVRAPDAIAPVPSRAPPRREFPDSAVPPTSRRASPSRKRLPCPAPAPCCARPATPRRALLP